MPIPMDVETSYEKDFKKRRDEERKKIAMMKKEHPDNMVIQEMSDDVMEEKMSEDRTKMDHFGMIRKAMWEAEELYTREGKDYKKVTDDLMEVIMACQKEYGKKDSKA